MDTTATGTPMEHAACPDRYRLPAPQPRPSVPPGDGLPVHRSGQVRDMAVGEIAYVAAHHLYQDTFNHLWISGVAFGNRDSENDDWGIRDVHVERVPAGLRVLDYNPETLRRIQTHERPHEYDVWVVEFPDPDVPVVKP